MALHSLVQPHAEATQTGRNTEPILTESVQSLYCHPLAFWSTALIGPLAKLSKRTKTKGSIVPCDFRTPSSESRSQK